MRKVKKNLLLVCFLEAVLGLYAQERKTSISFDYYTHDFGTIQEEGGTVSYEFGFSNAGNVSLVIKNVTASCGCAVPSWTKETIPPQGKGQIKVVFDPLNKPGPFSKTLTVEANAVNAPVLLTIQGKVVPRPRKPQDDYPDKIGNLRMLSRYMFMGEINTEQWQRKTFEWYNQADSAISIKNSSVPGTYLSVKFEPATLQPHSKGKIIVDYSPKWKNDYGHVTDRIWVLTDDKIEPIKYLYVTSFISLEQNLTPEEKALAPKIRLDKTVHQFGNIVQGEKPTATFMIQNVGKNDLQILKIKPSCGCTLVELEKKVLKQNESASLVLIFDTSGKEGIQEKHINIYTNDPTQFNTVITLKAKIIKPNQ